MKALVGAFNQEKALVGAFSVIVQPVVEPMDRFTALSRMLKYNFDRHFSTNRAPLGLHFNAEWIKKHKGFKRELKQFIQDMLSRNDVYFVTTLQV